MDRLNMDTKVIYVVRLMILTLVLSSTSRVCTHHSLITLQRPLALMWNAVTWKTDKRRFLADPPLVSTCWLPNNILYSFCTVTSTLTIYSMPLYSAGTSWSNFFAIEEVTNLLEEWADVMHGYVPSANECRPSKYLPTGFGAFTFISSIEIKSCRVHTLEGYLRYPKMMECQPS